MVQLSRRDERGAVAVMMALFLCFVFIILTALVVNLGHARDQRQASQNAADASALAAAGMLYASGSSTPDFAAANTAARLYAQKNFGITGAQWDACTDSGHFYVPNVTDKSPCISFTDNTLTTGTVTAPTKVRIRIPDTSVPDSLGAVAGGASSISVAAIARASLDTSGALPCGVCVLGPGTHSSGNGDVTVTGASIDLNGNLSTGPNGTYTATGNSISVQGTASGGCCSPTATTGAAQHPDPLLGVLTFPLPGTMTNGIKTNPCTDGPGRYGAYSLPNSTCTLLPGLYVITGLWDFKNSTTLQGTGVTLYFTCPTTAVPTVCNNATGGYIDIKNGNTNLTAPTTGALAGLVMAYDPTNLSPIDLQGNGNANFTGTIYAPSSTLNFPGNSCATTFDSAVIVGDVASSGNHACLSVNYSVNQNVKPPPSNAALDQ